MELFGTAGVRGDARDRVTPELAVAVGRAAASTAGPAAPTFVLGRDGRTTGPALAAAATAGLASAGARVVRLGRVPTPALAHASRGRHGLMVTASHNPPADNGLKLFADGVEYDHAAERRVEAAVRAADGAAGRNDDASDRTVPAGPRPAEWTAWGETERAEALSDYRAAVAAYAEGHGAAPGDLRIAVDAGNGVGALATPEVLRRLGADVVALNAAVDGHFPGRDPKPTGEALADLRAFVADDTDVDLAVAHDGDADRIAVVDHAGEVVHEDTVLAVLAAHYVRASTAGDPVVVTTPNASARIDERVEAAGGRVERVRLGALHEGVAAVRDGGAAGTEVVFAAEPWKHVHPALGGWIDGVASAAVLARLVAARGLADLRAPVSERPYRKVGVDCPDERKRTVLSTLETDLPLEFPDATVDTEHGVRLDLPDGSWLLVRPSGTEPCVRVYAESDRVEELIDRTVARVEAAVEAAGRDGDSA